MIVKSTVNVYHGRSWRLHTMLDFPYTRNSSLTWKSPSVSCSSSSIAGSSTLYMTKGPDLILIPLSSDTGIVQPVTFDPVVNIPALVSFLFIALVYTLLLTRVNAISSAVTRKNQALALLRKLKASQLDSSSSSNNNNYKNPDLENSSLKSALEEYEAALKLEMKLRTLLPGIRVIAPNDSRKNKEDIAAAQLFLGWNSTDWDTVVDVDIHNKEEEEEKSPENKTLSRQRLLMQSRRRFDSKVDTEKDTGGDNPLLQVGEHNSGGMSQSSRLVLLSIAFIQILLVVFLSLDPDVAKEILDSLDGSWYME